MQYLDSFKVKLINLINEYKKTILQSSRTFVLIHTNMRDLFRSVTVSMSRDDHVTFFKSLRDPHLFHFGQISRVEVVEEHETTTGNALNCARHDASERCLLQTRRTRGRRTAHSCGAVVRHLQKRKGGQLPRFLRHDRACSSATASFPLSESDRPDSLERSYDLYLRHTHIHTHVRMCAQESQPSMR